MKTGEKNRFCSFNSHIVQLWGRRVYAVPWGQGSPPRGKLLLGTNGDFRVPWTLRPFLCFASCGGPGMFLSVPNLQPCLIS